MRFATQGVLALIGLIFPPACLALGDTCAPILASPISVQSKNSRLHRWEFFINILLLLQMRLDRFELSTFGFVDRSSILLRYRRIPFAIR